MSPRTWSQLETKPDPGKMRMSLIKNTAGMARVVVSSASRLERLLVRGVGDASARAGIEFSAIARQTWGCDD
jgi:hypothetical protein